MADISKITLPTGDTYNIKDETARNTKANLASPTFTGTPKAPTAAAGTNTTQIATTEFVMNAFQANDAMLFKGTIGTGGTVTTLPDTHSQGWTYKVATAGTYAGKQCEIGDMIICVVDGTAANNDDWTVVQNNIDGAVTGPTSSVNDNIAVFDGTSGKVIKNGGVAVSGLSTATNWTNGTGGGSVKLGGTASGGYSVAEGEETLASGVDSHAEGYYSEASGKSSHAEGQYSEASGENSHAEGYGNTASGLASHAEGRGTVANHKSQHVFGEYNTEDVNSNGATLRGTYVEMVGNGTGTTNRSNARTLDWEGNEVLSGSITVNNAVTLQFNTTTNALDFIFA